MNASSKRGPKPKYASLAAQVEALSVAVPFSGCWIWIGAQARGGYGALTHQGKHMTAHRASYAAHNPGRAMPRLVCHDCDVPACVNPDHLYGGDFKTNRADMLNRNRWSHPWAARDTCAAGHKYEDSGYFISKSDGSRACRMCHRLYKQEQRKST